MANNTKTNMFLNKEDVILLSDNGSGSCTVKTSSGSSTRRCISTRSTSTTTFPIQRKPAVQFTKTSVVIPKSFTSNNTSTRPIAPANKCDSIAGGQTVLSNNIQAVQKSIRPARPSSQCAKKKTEDGTISEKTVQCSGFNMISKEIQTVSRNGQIRATSVGPAIPAGLTITPINDDSGQKNITPENTKQGLISTPVQQPIVVMKEKDGTNAIPQNASVFQKSAFFPKAVPKSVSTHTSTCFPHAVGPSKVIILAGATSPTPTTRGRPRGSRNKINEPVILTISDDEDANEELNSGTSATGPMIQQYCLRNSTHAVSSMQVVNESAKLELNPFKKPSSLHLEMERDEEEEDMDESLVEEEEVEEEEESSEGTVDLKSDTSHEEMLPDEITVNSNGDQQMVIMCRSVRVGSLKIHPCDGKTQMPILMTPDGFKFQAPTLKGVTETTNIVLKENDITQVLGHFGRCLPILFIFTTPACGEKIRKQLQMAPGDIHYFDPEGQDDRQKIITFLIENITDKTRNFLRNCFPGEGLLKEVDQKLANEILVKSTPQNAPPVQNVVRSTITYTQLSPAQPVQNSTPVAIVQAIKITPVPPVTNVVTKIVTYPPPPQIGGITITTEDLNCLQEGEFINDAIIDFYFKYLMIEKMSDVDRKRTHVFSSFFYPRLTQKNKVRSGEEGSSTMAVRRHTQVKTWTKNVDIFEKDFIIIPINQSAHWFLAIICFPGLVPETSPSPPKSSSKSADCVTSTIDGEACETPDANPISMTADEMPVKSTADQACCTDDQSSSEDGSFSNDVDSSLSEDPTPDTPDSSTHPDHDAHHEKMPCILIFDSLNRQNHVRIINTLREYLQMEWKIKKTTPRSFSKTSIAGHMISVPQQTNFSDCGIYVLQYVESFFEDPFPYFSHRMPDLSNWFPAEKVSTKREEIRKLILQLQNRQLSSKGNNSQAGPTGKESDRSPTAVLSSTSKPTVQTNRMTSS